MPISQTGALAEILSGGSLPLTGETIPRGQLAYFRERLKGRIFSVIVGAFQKQQRQDPTITQAAIARRLGRRPEQINRWLSGPSNMTVDTISDLVLAICGGEPSLAIAELHTAPPNKTAAAQQDSANSIQPAEFFTEWPTGLEASQAPNARTIRDINSYHQNGFLPLTQIRATFSDLWMSPLACELYVQSTNLPNTSSRNPAVMQSTEDLHLENIPGATQYLRPTQESRVYGPVTGLATRRQDLTELHQNTQQPVWSNLPFASAA